MDKPEGDLDFLHVPPDRFRAAPAPRTGIGSGAAGRAGGTTAAPSDILAVRMARLAEPRRSQEDPQGSDATRPAVALLARGSGWLDCGAAPAPLAAPALLLLPPGARRLVRLNPGARGVVVALESSFAHWLSAREPAFAALFRDPRTLPLKRSGAQLRSLEATLAALARELELAAAARLTAVEAHLQLLLTEALRLLERAPSWPPRASGSIRERSDRLVSEFLRLAVAHSRERWRLPDYARALHVSAGHLRATCVRVTGSPPVQLIHEYLIREAKRCLIATAAPVSAIALDLGFDDIAYFSRLFRAKSGFSPRQYRLSFRGQPGGS
jgi:AraC family transcriptional regulator, transcriptional activator of pobA